jgi:hypothetical protein
VSLSGGEGRRGRGSQMAAASRSIPLRDGNHDRRQRHRRPGQSAPSQQISPTALTVRRASPVARRRRFRPTGVTTGWKSMRRAEQVACVKRYIPRLT